jgi:hypothetical protein
MKRLLVGGVAALACLAVLGSTALAQANAQAEKVKRAREEQALVESKVAIRISPLPERVAQADCVATGKLGKVEDKNVKAASIYDPKTKVEYQVLPLTIDAGVVGVKKDAKTIRVAFMPPMDNGRGGRGPIIRPGRPQPLVLQKDMEGCFFLTKHPTEDFYVASNFMDFINKKDNANYDKDLKEIKRIGKMLAEPMKGLKAKDAKERAETATLLVFRYRSYKFGAAKTEAIPADESKLILQGLAEGDFTKLFSANQNEILPSAAFQRLGLSDKDGWKPTFQNYQTEFPPAAKAWLKENAGKYRIQRFVADKGEKKGK